MGHTMSVHSQNDDVILQFGLKKPAFRICVNTPTTHGSIGLTTGLDPAMTLGCGGWGGNITSDNISPRHLLNLKRVAYGIRPAVPSAAMAAGRPAAPSAASASPPAAVSDLPQRAARPQPRGISSDELRTKVDQFLSSRGYKSAADAAAAPAPPSSARSTVSSVPPATSAPVRQAIAEFVCEDDVRQALRAGERILIGERTIVTPSARDLGESQNVFQTASWPN